MWSVQPTHDQLPLHDGLKEYVGLLNQYNDAISSCRAASQKVTEIEAWTVCCCSPSLLSFFYIFEHVVTAQPEEPEREKAAKEKAVVAARRDIIHSLTLCEVCCTWWTSWDLFLPLFRFLRLCFSSLCDFPSPTHASYTRLHTSTSSAATTSEI